MVTASTRCCSSRAGRGGADGWWFDYTIKVKRKTLSLSTYPNTTLAAARINADEFRKLVAGGTDPSGVRKVDKAAQQASAAAESRTFP